MSERIQLEREPKDLEIDATTLERACSNLEAVAFTSAPLLVILADNLADAAERRGEAVVNQKRPGGFVAALVLPTKGIDGQPAILIDTSRLKGDVPPTIAAEFVHLFAHEGWHVVLTERGEHPTPVLVRLHERDSHGYLFGHIAIEAVNEYRVELPITNSDAAVEMVRAATIHRSLTSLGEKLDSAQSLDQGERSQEWAQQLNDDLHDLFGYLGVLAAHESVEHDNELAEIVRGHRWWQRLVGNYWSPFYSALGRSKSARDRMTPDELDAVVDEVGTLIRDWLPGQLGFEMQLEPAGASPGVHHVSFDTVLAEPEPELDAATEP